MLYYAIVFFVIALIAALFGFGGIAAGAAGIAKILFFAFLIIAIVTFLMSLARRDRVGGGARAPPRSNHSREHNHAWTKPRPRRRPRTPFLSDVKTLRERARQHIEQGAVTPGYGADAQAVCKVLNDALATEIVCVLRYKRHYYMAQGIHSEGVRAEFLEHANEEQAHADRSPSGSCSSAASRTSTRPGSPRAATPSTPRARTCAT